MSNWYLQIDEQGNPVNHPMLEENLVDIFKDGIPAQYHPFKRVDVPTPNIFQNVGNVPSYQKIDNVWQDVWPIVSKADEEIAQIKENINQEISYIKTIYIGQVNLKLADPSTTDAQKVAYNNYLAQLQDYAVTDYLNWKVPKIPTLDLNGNILS
jgi:hypothetical protein